MLLVVVMYNAVSEMLVMHIERRETAGKFQL